MTGPGGKEFTMNDQPTFNSLADWFEYGRESFKRPDGLEAVRAFTKVIDEDPGYRHTDGDNPYFYLGKINEVEGRLDEAISLYTRALAVDRHDEESLIGRGSCYTATQRMKEAISDFMQVIDLPARSRKVPLKHLFHAIAENHRKLEDWGQAIYWANRALNEAPGDENFRQLYERMMKGVPDSEKKQS
jgi:tetratricopeptide (TPR) repeat protein